MSETRATLPLGKLVHGMYVRAVNSMGDIVRHGTIDGFPWCGRHGSMRTGKIETPVLCRDAGHQPDTVRINLGSTIIPYRVPDDIQFVVDAQGFTRGLRTTATATVTSISEGEVGTLMGVEYKGQLYFIVPPDDGAPPQVGGTITVELLGNNPANPRALAMA